MIRGPISALEVDGSEGGIAGGEIHVEGTVLRPHSQEGTPSLEGLDERLRPAGGRLRLRGGRKSSGAAAQRDGVGRVLAGPTAAPSSLADSAPRLSSSSASGGPERLARPSLPSAPPVLSAHFAV